MAENIRHKAPCVSGRRQKKRLPPLSIRLNKDERATLLHQANGLPLSTYIKSVLFQGKAPSKSKLRRSSSAKSSEAAKLLALLGQTQIASNLSILANAAESGSLDLNEPMTQTLLQACSDIEEIRKSLMRELGKQTPSAAFPQRPSKTRITAAEFKILSQQNKHFGRGVS